VPAMAIQPDPVALLGSRNNGGRLGDSESFNQLVRTIPLRTKGCVMSNLDRVSGSFLAVIVGGLAILCGGLIVIAIGY
jgi:hypothetical protein